MKRLFLRFILFLGISVTCHAQTITEIKNTKDKGTQTLNKDSMQTKGLGTTTAGTLSVGGMNDNRISVIPPSPQSRLFDSYADQPAIGCSGAVSLDIPLYEIILDGLKIPLSLSYQSSGTKFKQYDGDIGAGWVLNPGYRVTRSVHGKADDYHDMPDNLMSRVLSRQEGYWRDKYLSSLAMTDYSWNNVPIPESSQLLDGEYDQFRYILPGNSGHFIITDRSSLRSEIIEGFGDKITLQRSNATYQAWIEKVKIVDEQGFAYHLGIGTDGVQTYEISNDVPSAWLLKDIVSPLGKTIRFEYAKTNVLNVDMNKQSYTLYDYIQHTLPSLSGIPMEGYTTLGSYNYTSSMAFVNKITTDREIIEFSRTLDIANSKFYQLDEIRIRSRISNELLRRITFTRKKNGPHWLLTGINIEGNTGGTVQQYKFDYSEMSVYPNGFYYYADQWGYYHSSPTLNNGWISFYHKEFENDRYGATAYVDGWVKNLIEGTLVERDRNPSMPDLFMLKKVTFPTGGWRAYEYEPHEFTGSQGRVQGGGLRLKQVTSNDNNRVMTRLYKYGENENGLGKPSFYVTCRQFVDELIYLEYKNNNGGLWTSYIPGRMRRFSTEAVGDADIGSYYTLQYPQIAIYDYDSSSGRYNGKTVETYTIPETHDFRLDTYGMWQSPFDNEHNTGNYVETYRHGISPLLSSRKIYKSVSSGSGFDPVSEESFSYRSTTEKRFSGLKVRQKVFTNYYLELDGPPPAGHILDPYQYFQVVRLNQAFLRIPSFFDYFTYEIVCGRNNLPESRTETLHTPSGTSSKSTSFSYNSRYHLSRESVSGSDNSTYTTDYRYPYEEGGWIYPEMTALNQVAQPMEQITRKNGQEIGRTRINYGRSAATSGFILPVSFQRSVMGSALETETTYDLYDSKGNLRQFTGKDGVFTSFLWGYGGLYPIAEIKGASYARVSGAISGSTSTIASLEQTSIPNMVPVNGLRPLLPEALITTYTYRPLYGIETMTDPRETVTTYTYDKFARLIQVKAGDKVIQSYDYHYKQ